MIGAKKIQRTRRILIVDDQEINRDVLSVILEDDYELLFAENGEEAMRVIEELGDELSLVLLDLFMPVMNGFEVLERIEGDERLKGIPVIVLTAEKSAELKALQMGAADFITKPFDLTEVIVARVARIIELSEGRHLISAAERDKITGLYSRNFFFEYAERLYTYHPETHFDAVVINIDQFHLINAFTGRAFGDEILRTIGEEIRAFLKGWEGISSRFEADRFAIYCAQGADYPALLKRLQKRADAVVSNVSVRLRMGVKYWREGVEPVTMFDRARAACSMARGDYQHPLVVYSEEMHERAMLNSRLINDLRHSVDERQLVVFYQPKYDLHFDPPRLSSAEALIRWRHPEFGMIPPGNFIPLLEGNGMISIVDNFVWREAASQIAEWKKNYHFTLPVSVNLSRADVFEPDLVDHFVGLVREFGLDFSDLKLEVTESAYTDNAKLLLEVIDALRGKGFQIEMDDFGSGYSSLNMLSAMPIDVLKIDMRFIRNLENSETDRRLIKLIIDIARYLHLTVVAEGVETEKQLAFLKNEGCDLVQGYYFSRPLPPEEFEKMIERELATERK